MLLCSNFLNCILWLSKLKMSGKWNWIELLYIAKDEGGGRDLVGFGYFQIYLIFIFDFNSFFCSWLGCVSVACSCVSSLPCLHFFFPFHFSSFCMLWWRRWHDFEIYGKKFLCILFGICMYKFPHTQTHIYIDTHTHRYIYIYCTHIWADTTNGSIVTL